MKRSRPIQGVNLVNLDPRRSELAQDTLDVIRGQSKDVHSSADSDQVFWERDVHFREGFDRVVVLHAPDGPSKDSCPKPRT